MNRRLVSVALTELLDVAAFVGVWILVGVPVGVGVVAVGDVVTVWLALSDLTTPLLVGVFVVAALEVLDKRPSLLRSFGFSMAWAFLGILDMVLAIVTPDSKGAILLAFFEVLRLTVAAGLAFGGGYQWLFTAGQSIVARLAKRPPENQHSR